MDVHARLDKLCHSVHDQSHTELRSFILTLTTSTGNGYTYHEGTDTQSDKGGSFVHNRSKEVH